MQAANPFLRRAKWPGLMPHPLCAYSLEEPHVRLPFTQPMTLPKLPVVGHMEATPVSDSAKSQSIRHCLLAHKNRHGSRCQVELQGRSDWDVSKAILQTLNMPAENCPKSAIQYGWFPTHWKWGTTEPCESPEFARVLWLDVLGSLATMVVESLPLRCPKWLISLPYHVGYSFHTTNSG